MISIFSFFVFYPLVPAFYQYLVGHSYGMLEVSINRGDGFYFKEMLGYVLVFQSIVFTFIIKSNFLYKEKLMLQSKLNISMVSAHFCCVIAIASILIMFPYMPFVFVGKYGRMSTFVVGQGWIGLSICSLSFAILSHYEDSFFVKITSYFVICWTLSHYERADISGFVILLFFVILVRKSNLKIKIRYIIVGIIIFLLLLLLEYTRVGTEFTFDNILEKIIVQVDASDLAYDYNIMIDFVQNNKLLHGESLKSYLDEIIPTVTSQNRIGTILRTHYYSPGGSHFFSEPLMNFGSVGLIIFFFFFIYALNQLVRNKSNYQLSYVLYAYVLMLTIRIVWYGAIFALTGLIWYVPMLRILCCLIDRSDFINRQKISFVGFEKRERNNIDKTEGNIV
jgi:hypothetical protein